MVIAGCNGQHRAREFGCSDTHRTGGIPPLHLLVCTTAAQTDVCMHLSEYQISQLSNYSTGTHTPILCSPLLISFAWLQRQAEYEGE